MQDNLIIPEKIKVGYVKRSDTYTGQLGFIVYTDVKGKLKKQKSWEGWRDKSIPPQDFKNDPTSGFVLNKDVGGTRRSYGWDARVEKVRVFDPRNFEFEISIPNLLFILQECSAIKGKGLEGDFVYAWQGKELILLPTTAQEYQSSKEYTDLQTEKVDKQDIEIGCSYLTKDKQEVVYMGKHIWWGKQMGNSWKPKHIGEKLHLFAKLNVSGIHHSEETGYLIESGFSKIAKRTSFAPIPQYAQIYDKLMKCSLVSKPVNLITKNEFKFHTNPDNWHINNNRCAVKNGKSIYVGEISRSWNLIPKFDIHCYYEANLLTSGIYNHKRKEYSLYYDSDYFKKEKISVEEIEAICCNLYIKCENGYEYRVI